MANKSLFSTTPGALIPSTNTVNRAGGAAYQMSDRAALAQYAATGCLNSTFYASAEEQLQEVIKLANKVDAQFVAKTATYSRSKGNMKDMPALLLAILAVRDIQLFKKTFPRVCDNGKMVKTFVQIIRSGAVGRKSMGTAVKKCVARWITGLTDSQLLPNTIGNDPSLKDLVLMVHPKPTSESRNHFYKWLIGKPYVHDLLPEPVKEFEDWKKDKTRKTPDLPFQLLSSEQLTTPQWSEIAVTASWQSVRMNLNTFARHGVLDDSAVCSKLAAKLRNEQEVLNSRVLPYQLLAAYVNTADGRVPVSIRNALQDAMEVAIRSIPQFSSRIVVCPDVSGSMSSPVTGNRGTATTSVSCKMVAALITAAIMRRNEETLVLPFSDHVDNVTLNPRDSVMTNAERLSALPSGGTDCSLPILELIRRKHVADVVILVSDNESWMDGNGSGRGTSLMKAWNTYRHSVPNARLICIDLAPNATIQGVERNDIMNIGGFSDEVFPIIDNFISGNLSTDRWVGVIEATEV